MGLFDSIVSNALKGALGQADSQALPGILNQILGHTDLGSLGGLLTTLQQSGLEQQVASWLGNGANQPISVDQLRNAIGEQRLQQITQATGLPIDQLLAVLAQHLPGTVDRMSPNGTLQNSPSPAAASSTTGSIADQAGLGDIR